MPKNYRRKGISLRDFGELLMGSGLVLSDICWVSMYGIQQNFDVPVKDAFSAFRGLYDFAHVTQILQGKKSLAEGLEEFFKDLDMFFPKRCLRNWHGSAMNGWSRYPNISALVEFGKLSPEDQVVDDGRPKRAMEEA